MIGWGAARRFVRRPWLTRRRVVVLGVVATLLVVMPPLVIAGVTHAHLHTGTDGVGRRPVALVLGAGVDAQGHPSAFLAERLRD